MDALNTPTYVRLRHQLRKDIVDGVWALGSHVTLAELVKHYQVSQNPVREALLQLQGEGVIAMRMNKGAMIPSVDARFIDHLYKIRGAIQSMLARDAAMAATPADIDRLAQMEEDRFKAALQGDIAACVAANRTFHSHMDDLADNPMARSMLEGRSALVDALRRQRGYGEGRLELVRQQHRALIEALRRHDGDGAARVVLEHTDMSRKDLLDLVAGH